MANYQGSITVKRRPKDGKDGANAHSPYIGADGYWYYWDDALGAYVKSDDKAAGPAGIQGPVPVQKEWVPGDTHRNNDEIKDYIYVRGSSGTTSYAYELASKGDVTAGAAPVGGAVPAGYKAVSWLPSLMAKVLIGEEANLANLIFKQDKLVSLRGTLNGIPTNYSDITNDADRLNFIPNITIDGKTGEIDAAANKVKFFPDGSGQLAGGNITWDTSGNLELTGTIHATSGEIGGFSIAGDDVYYGSLISNSTDVYIRAGSGTNYAAIGTSVLPSISGLVAVGDFKNSRNNQNDTNYGILVTVENALHNIAIDAKGDISCDGMIAGYPFISITPPINTISIINNSNSSIDTILVKITNSNSGIGLPSRYTIADRLDISSTTPFKFKMTLICSADSTTNGVIYGRTNEITALNNSNYPYRIDNNGVIQQSGRGCSKGDVFEFMLVWDGTNYRAYTINFRTT